MTAQTFPRVAARRVGGDHLVATSETRGRILGVGDTLSPDLPVHGIIKFGYWQEPDLDADETAAVLARYEAALSREGAMQRWLTDPAAPSPFEVIR